MMSTNSSPSSLVWVWAPSTLQDCVYSYGKVFFFFLSTFPWWYLSQSTEAADLSIQSHVHQSNSVVLHMICGMELRHAENSHLHHSLLSNVLQQLNTFASIQVIVSFNQFSGTVSFYVSSKNLTLSLQLRYFRRVTWMVSLSFL